MLEPLRPGRIGEVPGSAAGDRPRASRDETPVLEARGLTVRGGGRTILADVDFTVPRLGVTAVVGPSGAGKSTLLKCMNRLAELTPGLAVEGQVLLDGEPIYTPEVDPDDLRARVGMLFQRPVVFPGSIRDNVLFGLRHSGRLRRREAAERCERALVEAALWGEVRDRLGSPAAELSVGQQQRLCLARALALEPEVLLLDEPTSALDVAARRGVEELVVRLAERHAFVLVTHDLDQARRLGDRLVCVTAASGVGRVSECTGADLPFEDALCRETLTGLPGDRNARAAAARETERDEETS